MRKVVRLLHMMPMLFAIWLLNPAAVFAQNSDTEYAEPLASVLHQIEDRFKVKIKFTEEQVKGRYVKYASWRFRETLAETFTSVLTPLDLKVNQEKESVYKLKPYEYFRWNVADGWAKLDRLASAVPDKASWEDRCKLLRPQLFAALQLSPLPPKPKSKPIISNHRVMDGYTIENIALEIMPGLYINGSLYRPQKIKGKIPVILSPDGHWEQQRYRADCQIRCAMIARMGGMAFSYDLFAWGESLLQFKEEDHRKSLAQTVQALGAIRILDYLEALPETDPARVGISGGSGGGSHTVLMTALDDRIRLTAPVVSLSSYFYGGCPCESGMPVYSCGRGTNPVELAAMAAPRPQLVVSDGKDWTAQFPEHDFAYLKKIYGYYGAAAKVQNVHLPAEGHDFGFSKRKALYDFLVQQFALNGAKVKDVKGNYDESPVKVEEASQLYVFGEHGEHLPANAIKGFDELEKVFTVK
ncbi:Acetyl xylan esterase (AXE1) [Pedobacter westerhofensis]|uniref:Acetyl xylan esterase (AXE1) n=1 Tax=Pedobacter westerhofensis TaxID=425512 RepID=A0A521AM60_9SPHI|nr:acetylxylan esterase [Pedobacter westerhofensis]SMO35740.1 Acetyl xylan esterase (AXE1) [Pedobacter westerhofensis]